MWNIHLLLLSYFLVCLYGKGEYDLLKKKKHNTTLSVIFLINSSCLVDSADCTDMTVGHFCSCLSIHIIYAVTTLPLSYLSLSSVIILLLSYFSLLASLQYILIFIFLWSGLIKTPMYFSGVHCRQDLGVVQCSCRAMQRLFS